MKFYFHNLKNIYLVREAVETPLCKFCIIIINRHVLLGPQRNARFCTSAFCIVLGTLERARTSETVVSFHLWCACITFKTLTLILGRWSYVAVTLHLRFSSSNRTENVLLICPLSVVTKILCSPLEQSHDIMYLQARRQNHNGELRGQIISG
jgi:hypothetical protein